MTGIDDQLQQLLQQIGRTTFIHPKPGDGFDPWRAAPEELREHGLPAEPDPRRQPLRHAFWTRLMSPPPGKERLTFVRPSVSRYSALFSCVGSSARRILLATRHERSPNWSGAYVTPKGGRGITSVHAAWTVPRPKLPVGPDEPPEKEHVCSTWVGLDGQRAYLDSSLPQIGIAQKIKNGKAEPVVAWWQWGGRDQKVPVMPIDIRIEPGQEILAQVEVVGDSHVRFIIKNQDTGDIMTPIRACAPLAMTEQAGEPVRISGGTAEWITERPTPYHSEEPYRLPDYGKVVFRDCLACTPDAEQDLTGATLIDMFETRGSPQRTRDVSVAALLDTRRVATRYQ